MDDAHDAEHRQTPYIRLPWPLVAAGLAGMLLVALGAGLFANRYLRPQLGVQPSPVAAVGQTLATGTSAPSNTGQGVTPVASPTLSAPVSTSAASTTVVPMPTPSPAVVQSAPTTIPTATSTRPTQSVIGADRPASAPSPVAIVDPQLASEVGNAYQSYWRVRSQALLQLDASHLSEVMDGYYLGAFESQLENLRVQGRAIKTQVTLNYVVAEASSDAAIVVDHIEDESYYVTPGTFDPLTDPSNDLLRVQFRLVKVVAVWKVVDSVSAD